MRHPAHVTEEMSAMSQPFGVGSMKRRGLSFLSIKTDNAQNFTSKLTGFKMSIIVYFKTVSKLRMYFWSNFVLKGLLALGK